MNLLRAALGLGTALVIQATLGRIWPGAHRFVDALLVVVVWYGVSGTQRSAMFVGCAGGLLRDAWFQIGTFGLSGFKWTLLGWLLGLVDSRLDLDHQGGRFAAGAAASVADSLLDFGLRRLLDQQPSLPGPVEFVVKSLVTGLLATLVGAIVDRGRGRYRIRRTA